MRVHCSFPAGSLPGSCTCSQAACRGRRRIACSGRSARPFPPAGKHTLNLRSGLSRPIRVSPLQHSGARGSRGRSPPRECTGKGRDRVQRVPVDFGCAPVPPQGDAVSLENRGREILPAFVGKSKSQGTMLEARKGPVKASLRFMSGESGPGRVHCESSGRVLPGS